MRIKSFCGRNLSFCDQNHSTGVFRRAASGLSWAVARVDIEVRSTQRAVDRTHRSCTRRSEVPKATDSAELGAEMTEENAAAMKDMDFASHEVTCRASLCPPETEVLRNERGYPASEPKLARLRLPVCHDPRP
jgi:hypothetical protein